MAMIKVQNLTFSYNGGSADVFNNVNFTIDTTWKLGLVGRNGRGKTTFLKLLLGEYEYDGNIISNERFTYFPFEVKDKSRFTLDVLYEVSNNAEYWQIQRELNKLEIDESVLFRPFDSLSGGEQTKILLAGLFLNDGNFLLIDEPTNHLDYTARKEVSKYLNGKSAYILVSHDRAFLDGCVDHILSINKADIEVQSGNFSSWFSNFQKQQAFENTQNERLKKDIKRLSDSAERTSQWARAAEKQKSKKSSDKRDSSMVDKGFIGHKAAKMTARAKAIATRKEAAIEEKSKLLKNNEYAADLKLSPLVYRIERLAYLSGVSIKFGKTELPPVSLQINRGERIALNGKNGCGKSSIVKLLIGEAIDFSGRLSVPNDLIISYVPQHANLTGSLKTLAHENKIDEGLFKAILHKMDFKRDELFSDVSHMSEGQKKKVLIAKSLCEKAHLYVWDEPLNYIDIYSRLQIEKLITEFNPTMLFVEHDAAFVNNIATRIIEM